MDFPFHIRLPIPIFRPIFKEVVEGIDVYLLYLYLPTAVAIDCNSKFRFFTNPMGTHEFVQDKKFPIC